MLREARSLRASSWDRTGGNHDFITIEPGATATLAEIEGAGCIRHIWFTIVCPYTWFGEGDDMMFVDADTWPPSLHGTGTEDYFCEAWGFPSGAYAGPYHGISLAGDAVESAGQWSVYRFHIEDPVHFGEWACPPLVL